MPIQPPGGSFTPFYLPEVTAAYNQLPDKMRDQFDRALIKVLQDPTAFPASPLEDGTWGVSLTPRIWIEYAVVRRRMVVLVFTLMAFKGVAVLEEDE